jgi:hypothetical protein
VCRYIAVARLKLFTSFAPTPSLGHVVSVIVPCVIVVVPKCMLVTFHTERICTVLHTRLNSLAKTCILAPDNCQVVDTDRHLLASYTFCGQFFRSCGLSRHLHSRSYRNTTSSQPPACGASLLTLRPPNRRHAVLRFRAVGRPMFLPTPCPPPFNGVLIIGLHVGLRPRAASPFRRCASSSRSLRTLPVMFCLSVVGPPKEIPRKQLDGHRAFYSRA